MNNSFNVMMGMFLALAAMMPTACKDSGSGAIFPLFPNTGDSTPPVPGDSGTITTGSITIESVELSWTAGIDDNTDPVDLEYAVYRSFSDYADSITDWENFGTLVQDYAPDMTGITAADLESSRTYYFIVIIKDLAGNQAAYTSKSARTAKAPLDIRADNNRDGVIDFDNLTDDTNESTWDADHGAIFLANIDDDQDACPNTGTDAALAACNDAADNVVNGESDLLDMARIKTAPVPTAPADAYGTITVSSPGSSYLKLYKKNGTSFDRFTTPGNLTLAEVQNGVELAIEATDIVRDDSVWDGFVDITYTAYNTAADWEYHGDSDTVKMRVAPVLFHNPLNKPVTVYTSYINSSEASFFRTDLSYAMSAAEIANPLFLFTSTSDYWAGDYFKTAYMAMPAQGGNHVININFRSSNYTGSALRTAGKFVFTVLRGPDVAGAVQYDPAHDNAMDTLNSFSNLLVIPPYSYGGTSWPLGRMLRGSSASFYPDTTFDRLVRAQGLSTGNASGIQDIVTLDTNWLLTGHVAEVFNFIKSSSGTHGWKVLVPDPTLAWNMLLAEQTAGNGGAVVFNDMVWYPSGIAETTIDAILADADLDSANDLAVTEIAAMVASLKSATGITDSDFIKVPALFHVTAGYLVPYMPSMVKGIYLSDTCYAAPEPHGPIISGADIFKDKLESDLLAEGITVYFVEDWDYLHKLDGNVYNAANTKREISADVRWWESGY